MQEHLKAYSKGISNDVMRKAEIIVSEIKQLYKERKKEIIERLNEFKNIQKKKSDKQLFAELCFCLLTPQSKAKLCWAAVLKLKQNGLLFDGNKNQVKKYLTGVRFKNRKSEYIVNARKFFPELKQKLANCTDYELRKWLVKNISGFGYKEASHFLRNIGLANDFAILDRHILKNLKECGIIKHIPLHLTAKRYIEIETRMKLLSKKLQIPVSHLDLLFWSKETGEIFK